MAKHFSACPKCHTTYESLNLKCKTEVTFSYSIAPNGLAEIDDHWVEEFPTITDDTVFECNNCGEFAPLSEFRKTSLTAEALVIVQRDLASSPEVFEALNEALSGGAPDAGAA